MQPKSLFSKPKKILSTTCTWCMLGPLEKFIFGFRPYDVKCDHKYGRNKIKFNISPKLTFIWLIMFLLCCFLIHKNTQILQEELNDYDKSLISVCHITYLALDFTLLMICPLKYLSRVYDHVSFSRILENTKNICLKNYLTYKEFNILRNKIKQLRYSILASCSLYALGVFLEYIFNHNTVYTRRFSTIFGYYTYLCFMCQCTANYVVKNMHNNLIFKNIKKVLSRKGKEKSTLFSIEESKIQTEISRLNRIYIHAHKHNYMGKRNFNDFQSLFLIPIMLCYTFVFVLMYLMIVNLFIRFIEKETFEETLVFVIGRGITLLPFFGYIKLIENMQNPGEDIASFLFRFPISKLSQAEAAQVEMLITTLHLQKPILRASDIFTVGTKLIASITGTVVTYVLVALQFQASWTNS